MRQGDKLRLIRIEGYIRRGIFVLLIKLIYRGTMRRSPRVVEAQAYYRVEAIWKKRIRNGKPEFLVQWESYEKKTWESSTILIDLPDMVREFEEKESKKKKIAQTDAKKSIAKRDEIPKGTKKPKRGGAKNRGTRASSNRNKMKIESPSSDNEEIGKNSPKIELEGEDYRASTHSTPDEEPFHLQGLTQEKLDETSDEEYESDKDEVQANINYDMVKEIHDLRLIDGIYMVLVEFKSRKLKNKWQKRDLLRMLYPYHLLLLYEKIKEGRLIPMIRIK